MLSPLYVGGSIQIREGSSPAPILVEGSLGAISFSRKLFGSSPDSVVLWRFVALTGRDFELRGRRCAFVLMLFIRETCIDHGTTG